MPETKIRQIAEKLGTIIAFMPDPPSKDFRSDLPQYVGHLHVEAISCSQLPYGEEWVRGWMFTMKDSDGEMVEYRYLDQSELVEIREMLRNSSDEDVELGFEYHSLEGILLKKFTGAQRITFLTPGRGTMHGVQRKAMVAEVCAFLESSAKLWE